MQLLSIRNFKSLKDVVELHCSRVNIFVGEPGTGKSNLLEALGLFSWLASPGSNSKEFVRYEQTKDLFHDGDLDHPIEVSCDTSKLVLGFKDGIFEGNVVGEDGRQVLWFGGRHDGIDFQRGSPGTLSQFKYYKFHAWNDFPRQESEFLLPPSGLNLASLLLAHKPLRAAVNDLLAPFGLKLGIRAHENKVEAVKQAEDVIISYPYYVLSDTLQRLIFYMAAIKRNKESVIIFEEPEAHAFPYYTKYLAEIIALDQNKNQYFISTHNPYFLEPLLEKAPAEDVTVFVTSLRDHQTKLRSLSKNELQKLVEIDIFLNLDMFQGGA